MSFDQKKIQKSLFGKCLRFYKLSFILCVCFFKLIAIYEEYYNDLTSSRTKLNAIAPNILDLNTNNNNKSNSLNNSSLRTSSTSSTATTTTTSSIHNFNTHTNNSGDDFLGIKARPSNNKNSATTNSSVYRNQVFVTHKDFLSGASNGASNYTFCFVCVCVFFLFHSLSF